MDDLLPNDGSVFDPSLPSPEQQKEERREQSLAESSYPIINDLIKILEGEISQADSIRGMGITASMSQTERDLRFLSRADYADLCEGLLNQIVALKDMVDKG